VIRWDQKETIEGYTVIPDQDATGTWAILPREPRFRLGPDGKPVLFAAQYRSVIEADGGRKVGGIIVCDVEYAIPAADRAKVATALQPRLNAAHGGADGAPQVRLIDPSYTSGKANVQFLDAGGTNTLVERVQVPALPALYGNLGLPITVELSPEGATFCKEALFGTGGILQVPYMMKFPVAMPPMSVRIWFNAAKFMEFHQHVEIDWSMWGQDDYRESVSEQFRSSESSGIVVDPGAVTDQKVVADIADWARRSLDDAVKRMVIPDIPEVGADDRKVPDGIDNLWRDIEVGRMVSFDRTYTQGQVIEIETAFSSATVPNIGAMKDAQGNPIDVSQYWREIDLDDEFLKTIRVSARANADFAHLPIDSVEVKISYADTPPREYSLTKADDVAKFEQYTDGKGYDYTYSYQVNYVGEAQRYQSPDLPSDEQVLTINVGDTGVLDVQVFAGDIDFSQVQRARLTLTYGDATRGIPAREETVILDKEHPTGRVQRVVFAPVDQPYSYQVVYEMAGGKQLTVKPRESRSEMLFVNDPFADTRTVGIRGFGDFDTRIDTIFLNAAYTDAANDYQQTATFALTKSKPFADWTFPVVDGDAGTVTYSGTVMFKGGAQPQDIPEQSATRNTIMVGDLPKDVVVMGDLVDFGRAKLVKVALHYTDAAHGIDVTKDVILKAGQTGPVTWSHAFKAGDPRYSVTVTYFLVGGGTRTVGPLTTGDDTFLVPEVPA
jgi:hypothetical protein